MEEVDGFMVERELDLSGVLTTFKKKGEGRREVLIALRTGGAIKEGEVAQTVFGGIVEGMEEAEVLSLAEWKAKGFKDEKELSNGERWGKVWKQVNADATRKQVAPVIVSHESAAGRGTRSRHCMLMMMVA
jgi:exopolyphosphatase